MRRYIGRALLLAILGSGSLLGQTAPSSNSSTAPAANSNAAGTAPVLDWLLVGHGTPGHISQFVAPYKLADSNIFQAGSGNLGIGTTNPIFPFHLFTNSVTPPAGQSSPIGLWVDSEGSSEANAVIAIEGLAGAASGQQIGVNGTAFSPEGTGVLGNHPGNNGGGSGVVGLTNSITGFTTGVSGVANGSSGPGVGIFGQAFSPTGIAGLFINRPGGNILVGSVSQNPDIEVFRVDGTGRVFANGGFQPSGADFAESMTVAGDRAKYSAGDLLVIDSTANRRVALAQQPYSTLVAGIYSTKPGLLGSTRGVDEPASPNEIPLAVVGIVPCKVTAENGAIQIGDLLVTSSAPGRAMKGTDRSKLVGAVVGKALEALAGGEGTIQVLVTLQ